MGIKYSFTGLRDLGSYFENYLFLKMKHHDIYYVYRDGTEIDFYLRDIDLLVESKYNSEMNLKQKKLFHEFKAGEKLVINSVYKAEELDRFE